RPLAYRLGLGGAMITRIMLLLTLNWVMHLEYRLFTAFGDPITVRDVIMLLGGFFLVGKSAHEIYEKVELDEDEAVDVEPFAKKGRAQLGFIIAQIAVMDIIFSLDSVVTAVGMVQRVPVMVAAIVVAVIVMLIFARRVGDFINRHPSMKVLALSFMLLIGVLL